MRRYSELRMKRTLSNTAEEIRWNSSLTSRFAWIFRGSFIREISAQVCILLRVYACSKNWDICVIFCKKISFDRHGVWKKFGSWTLRNLKTSKSFRQTCGKFFKVQRVGDEIFSEFSRNSKLSKWCVTRRKFQSCSLFLRWRRALEIYPILSGCRRIYVCFSKSFAPNFDVPRDDATETKIQGKQKQNSTEICHRQSSSRRRFISQSNRAKSNEQRDVSPFEACLFSLFLLFVSFFSPVRPSSRFSQEGDEINSAFLRNWRAPRAEDIFSGPLLPLPTPSGKLLIPHHLVFNQGRVSVRLRWEEILPLFVDHRTSPATLPLGYR